MPVPPGLIVALGALGGGAVGAYVVLRTLGRRALLAHVPTVVLLFGIAAWAGAELHGGLMRAVSPVGESEALAAAVLIAMVAAFLAVFASVAAVGGLGRYMFWPAIGLAAFITLILVDVPLPAGGAYGAWMLALLALAVMAPPLFARGLASRRAPRVLAVLAAIGLLLITSPMSLLFALIAADGSAGPAEYRWELELSPSGVGNYSAQVPFLVALEPRSHPEEERVVAAFRDRVRVVEGMARWSFVDDATLVSVSGEGPVGLRADLVLYGDREDLSGWPGSLPRTWSVNASAGNFTDVDVRWVAWKSYDGCTSSLLLTTFARSGETGRLRDENGRPPNADSIAGVCS